MRFIVCLLVVFSFMRMDLLFSDTKEIKVFNNLKEEYTKGLPNSFIARIEGTWIRKSLNKIPKAAYCSHTKKGFNNLRVSYIFLKGLEESIIVENVENPYINRFQSHLEIYKKAKWFLDIDKSFEELKHTLYWKVIGESAKYYIIKTRKRRFRKTDYLILYISKKDYTIKRAIQYSNNKKLASLSLRYRKLKGYTLLSALNFSIAEKKGKIQNFSLIMSDYKINVELSTDMIINLQDDCPSLANLY